MIFDYVGVYVCRAADAEAVIGTVGNNRSNFLRQEAPIHLLACREDAFFHKLDNGGEWMAVGVCVRVHESGDQY